MVLDHRSLLRLAHQVRTTSWQQPTLLPPTVPCRRAAVPPCQPPPHRLPAATTLWCPRPPPRATHSTPACERRCCACSRRCSRLTERERQKRVADERPTPHTRVASRAAAVRGWVDGSLRTWAVRASCSLRTPSLPQTSRADMPTTRARWAWAAPAARARPAPIARRATPADGATGVVMSYTACWSRWSS
jgi:hypothetical protein